MSCLFCGIASGKIPSQVLRETDDFIVIKDINPQAPVHALFIPKRHLAGIHEIDSNNQQVLSALFLAANDMAKQLKIKDQGYRLVINSGADGGQTVDHLHLHLLGGRKMNWPPG